MPAKSKKQKRFMQAVAHNKAFAKKVGVPQSVGKEYSKAEGGIVAEKKPKKSREQMIKDYEEAGKRARELGKRYEKTKRPEDMDAAMEAARKAYDIKPLDYKKGGVVKKRRDGIATRGKTRGRFI